MLLIAGPPEAALAELPVAAVPLAPLDGAQRRRLAAIPDEHAPAPQRHHFRSNEWYQGLLRAPLRGRGGAYVGVGSDQNYTMAALAGSELLLLADYDPRIRLVHRIYDVLVRASETPAALVQRFAAKAEADTCALLEQRAHGAATAGVLVTHFVQRRALWHRYLRRVQSMRGGERVTSWLADPGLYAHVRALFLAGRVVSRNGDLGAGLTLGAIGDAARALRLPVRVVYLSNAEQSFQYTPAFLANMQALPTDARSVAVRTLHHGPIPNAGPNDWHYLVHEFPDFVARMQAGYRKCFRFSADLLAARSLGPDGVSVLTAAVPRVTGARVVVEPRLAAAPRAVALAALARR